MPKFTDSVANVNGQEIAYSIAGKGPAVLLLHGFPQTRAMWQVIGQKLAKNFTVITADLRGYGGSSKPKGVENYSFRQIANDQLALMRDHLGLKTFHLVGHDRGGRTAHRLALDSPTSVLSITLMDIIPTHTLLHDLSPEVATAYYHWFFLAQPHPLPENMIGADPIHFFQSCLRGWGTSDFSDFPAKALAAYEAAWRDPECIRAMCDDYRAALQIDYDLDASDLDRRISCPSLILYGEHSIMAKLYDVPQTWSDRLTSLESKTIPGGHFFPDTSPDATQKAIFDFISKY